MCWFFSHICCFSTEMRWGGRIFTFSRLPFARNLQISLFVIQNCSLVLFSTFQLKHDLQQNSKKLFQNNTMKNDQQFSLPHEFFKRGNALINDWKNKKVNLIFDSCEIHEDKRIQLILKRFSMWKCVDKIEKTFFT